MNFISYCHYGKEEGKKVLGDLVEADYDHIFYDKSTNTNTIVQQMIFAIINSCKVLAPDVELRQGEKKDFPMLFVNRILMKD